jgi:hypothetical protein
MEGHRRQKKSCMSLLNPKIRASLISELTHILIDEVAEDNKKARNDTKEENISDTAGDDDSQQTIMNDLEMAMNDQQIITHKKQVDIGPYDPNHKTVVKEMNDLFTELDENDIEMIDVMRRREDIENRLVATERRFDASWAQWASRETRALLRFGLDPSDLGLLAHGTGEESD